MSSSTTTTTYTRKDFSSDQEVRWCPGCGDYSILNGVQQVFATLGVPREQFVVVSGIGCSSRFPYYMNTFGFHTIHGRSLAVATGVKIANPALHVWVVTGDGDALSIGGNHLIHAMRRNLNLKVLLFNNRIYGLTKGQASPTTVPGKSTPSTPFGLLDTPFNPIAVALGAGASFVARTVDTQLPHLKSVIEAAHHHRGFAFVEILQNCLIFNNGAFEHFTERSVVKDRQVDLRPGEPLVFGQDQEKGLRITADSIEFCLPEEATVWREDGSTGASAYRMCLGSETGDLPVPVGIFRRVTRPVLEDQIHEQIREATVQLGEGTLENLLHGGDTWTVPGA